MMASDLLNDTVKNVLSSMNKNIERLDGRTALMTRHIVDLMDRIEQLDANNKELKEIVAKVTKNPEEEEKQKIRQANLAFIKSQWYINPTIYYKMKKGVDFGDVDVLKNICGRTSSLRNYMLTYVKRSDKQSKLAYFAAKELCVEIFCDIIDSVGYDLNKQWMDGKCQTSFLLSVALNTYSTDMTDFVVEKILHRLKKYNPAVNKVYCYLNCLKYPVEVVEKTSFREIIENYLTYQKRCKDRDSPTRKKYIYRLEMVKKILLD